MKHRVNAADYSEWKSSVGVAIGRRRHHIGRTVEQTAEKAQISPELLNSIETGGGHLTLQQLYRLCRVLEIPMSQLLLGADPVSTSAETSEFIHAYNQIKDPELKNQISSLVSAMAHHQPGGQSRD